MIITKLREFDLLEPPVQEPVHAVQCDANTRAVAVTLTVGGVAWEPPADTGISVAFKKPDGKKGWYDKLPDKSPACSVSGNVVTAILAPEVLTAAGKVDAVIVFQDKNLNQLATFGFSILVEPNPAAGRGISNDYYKYSTMEEVSDAVEEMLDSLEGTKADIGQLILQAGEAVSRVEQEAGAAIVCEETGTVITVADSAERPLQGLKVFGRTVQDGIPTPDSPVPLKSVGAGGSVGVTVAGKNLWNNQKAKTPKDVSASVTDDGFTRTETGFAYTRGSRTGGTYIYYSTPIYKGQTVMFSAKGSTRNPALILYKDKIYGQQLKNSVSLLGYTAGEDIPNATFAIVISSTEGDCVYSDIQIEIGDAVTAYEPYRPAQTLTARNPNGLPGMPVAYGGNYTDENGQQWLCDEVDLAGGVYVKWFATDILTGEEEWKEYANRPGAFNAPGTGIAYGGMCSHYPVGFDFVDGTVWLNYTVANIICDSRFTGNVDGLKAFLAEQYAAGTPVTVLRRLHVDGGGGEEIALSAEELTAYAAMRSNKPNTTVYNDAGAHMELSYVADTKLYIDQKFTALKNAILSAGANV